MNDEQVNQSLEAVRRHVFDGASYYGEQGGTLAKEAVSGHSGPREEGMTEPYGDDELFREAMELRNLDLTEKCEALRLFLEGAPLAASGPVSPFAGNPLIVQSHSERWDGTSGTTKVYKSLTEALDTTASRAGLENVFADCEITDIWDENGRLFVRGAHHDGSVLAEIRQLTDQGESVYGELSEGESIVDPITLVDPYGPSAFPTFNSGDEGKLFDFMWHNAAYSAAPRYAERAFGCPSEECEKRAVNDPLAEQALGAARAAARFETSARAQETSR